MGESPAGVEGTTRSTFVRRALVTVFAAVPAANMLLRPSLASAGVDCVICDNPVCQNNGTLCDQDHCAQYIICDCYDRCTGEFCYTNFVPNGCCNCGGC